MIILFVKWFLIVMSLGYAGVYMTFRIDKIFNLEKLYNVIENNLIK